MKKQVIYIHGGDSFKKQAEFIECLHTRPLRDGIPGQERQKRWTDSLATDLGDQYEVYAPSMPNKQNADYEEWKVWFERYLALVSDGVILVGLSLGAQFFAKYMAENKPPVKITAAFLLAGPSGLIPEPGGDNPAWLFDLAALRQATEGGGVKTYILHSEDDPVVPYEHALTYAKALPQATLVPFVDKGHFLVPALPELLELITRV